MVALLLPQHTSICVGPANAPCACSSPPGTATGMAPLDRAEQTQCAPVPGSTGRDEAGAAAPCPMLPCACSPQQPALPGIGASLVPQGFVFLPTPASWHAGSRKGRTCRLSDRSSLSWRCGWRRRGCGTVVSGTGKCRQWGGGSLQPGFLSCTATTSQIKVLPGGAAAAPRALGRAQHSTHGPSTWVAGWQPACIRAGCSRCSLLSCSASVALQQPLSR